MVGIVIVSHSATLAEGVVELARQMSGPDVRLEAAGGLDAPDHPLGTDAMLVLRAIERAFGPDGVLVLMDLGSAVLSAEMALDMLPAEQRGRVRLCEAPLVEGAVAAAVTARLGAPLEQVAAEARDGLRPKAAHLGTQEKPAAPGTDRAPEGSEDVHTATLMVENPLGLHARPAARFVQTSGGFDADVRVTNTTTGQGPASGRSLNALATLGVRRGHQILVTASGPQAAEALRALQELCDRDFDEEPAPAPPPSPPPPPEGEAAPGDRSVLVGLPASPGIAVGPARRFRSPDPVVPTHRAPDPAAEWSALQDALAGAREEIRRTRVSVAARAGEYHAGIFDAHLLILEDEALLDPARRLIFEEGRNAADAWNAAASDAAGRFRSLPDEYLRARAEDVEAVARTVIAHLLGTPHARPALEGPGILVAADLEPAHTAGLDRRLVQGIATAFGGTTSHSAILARSLDLPAVVGLGEALLSVPEGTPILVDGRAGRVYVDPAPDLVREHEARMRASAEVARAARAAAHQPAVTRDGRQIEVAANVGSAEEAAEAVELGAEGVGLLRTEFLFLGRSALPSEEEQYEAYLAIAEALGGRPLILRTLDVGADKPLPFLPALAEANPFLGTRGIRLSLLEPNVLLAQLRAVLRVAARFPLKVMFPMVATLEEYRKARGLLDRARSDLEERGEDAAPTIDVGVMVEVPGVALVAGRFAPHVDFFSIGTNDLAQYTMAADRGNERVAALADPLHPAILRLVDEAVRAATAHGRWVGVCGEAAGDPVATPILVGLGVKELSMNGPAIPAVKQAIRDLDAEEARRLAETAMELETAAEVRALDGSSRP